MDTSRLTSYLPNLLIINTNTKKLGLIHIDFQARG